MELTESNTKFRNIFANYEQEMQDSRNEIIEIKKSLGVFKANNERLRDENEAYKSQNAKYLKEIKEMDNKNAFDEELKNNSVIADAENAPEALGRKVINLEAKIAKLEKEYLKESD